jgi:hypothetical protein
VRACVLGARDQNTPSQVGRSAQRPDMSLQLNYVFGYSGPGGAGGNWAPGLFYNKQGNLAYYTAGVGVVRDSCAGPA